MVPVKASVSDVSLLQLSPIFPSIPFSPETPDTQAKKVLVITTRDCYILSDSFTTHESDKCRDVKLGLQFESVD